MEQNAYKLLTLLMYNYTVVLLLISHNVSICGTLSADGLYKNHIMTI